MVSQLRVSLVLPILLLAASVCRAEVFVRWTLDEVPSPQALGVATLAVPVANRAAVRDAIARGYRVYLEVPPARLAALTLPAGAAGVLVKGTAPAAALGALRQRVPAAARVIALDDSGTWPHIRSNWVTKNNDVLQVAGRSAQPWIESNAAAIRVVQDGSGRAPVLSYEWTGLTVSDTDEGPALEHYLVAIAEAGGFGADLVLPLHERFQRRLLLGQPDARVEWQAIRQYIDFYAGDLPNRYAPMASVGLVTSAPMAWVQVMDLLARHNLTFEVIPPSKIGRRPNESLKTFIVLDPPDAAQVKALAAFEQAGGSVIVVGPAGGPAASIPGLKARVIEPVADPNRFALDIRRLLGREGRALDIWNGITVLAAPYLAPQSSDALVTLTNFAHQFIPVQLSVRGTFARVQFESPEETAPQLLPHEHRDGRTEFVVPALRVGGRIFLSR